MPKGSLDLHFLSYGHRGVHEGPERESERPRPLCKKRVFAQVQLTSNERRVTCPQCLELLHRTMPNHGGTPEEGPLDHVRNALTMVMHFPNDMTLDAEQRDALNAISARLVVAAKQLVNRNYSHKPNRRIVRRRNPALMVLGANPRVVDATIATWAKIEYRRPDDPDGKNIIRVHEFKDGFEIGWLTDGSVQLSHPNHPLWMDDKE